MTRRILYVWLPHWPITRRSRSLCGTPDRPVVTVETIRNVRHLTSVGVHGEAQGLHPGQTLSDARAICPDLIPVDAEPAEDAAALTRLARWCERYTPMAAPDLPDGMWLDITGGETIFGSEADLLRGLAQRLDWHALPAHLAIAGTAGAAWALAHHAPNQTIVASGQEEAALAGLPLASLRLDASVLLGLRRLGLRTVQDLMRIPRAEITPRFGSTPIQRLDQALGKAQEAIDWPRPMLEWIERISFAEPIAAPDDLTNALSYLAERLCERLDAQRKGGDRFIARFFRVDDETPEIEIGTARPVHDPLYLAKLLHSRLETIDPGFGVEVISLEATGLAFAEVRQSQFSDLTTCASTDVAEIVDSLTNRLSAEHVWRVSPYASHVPERVVQPLPPVALSRFSWESDPDAPRPIRLLRRPEPIEVTALLPDHPPVRFRWRGALHRVHSAAGPERIAAEWWRTRRTETQRPETDLIRDYYRIEDTDGARFWIFRAGLVGVPQWYLHGLFA